MEEQNIPIDINAGKLLDWLINRRHCNKGWQSNILAIRTKINSAIQDMPAHEGIANLISGTHINYFHCKKIIEILKETEADTKNLFGRYGSQRMKDWQEIICLYEKDNLYLAEAAEMLMRNMNYEVPSFKKQIQKFEQTQHEMEKKESEYEKSKNAAQNEFNALCKQLRIAGNKIKRELGERIVELPEIYENVARKAKTLDKAIEFYEAFVEFTLGHCHDGGSVPIIKYLIEKGNTTTYEWTYGEAPLTIVEPLLNIYFKEENCDREIIDDAIDFGDEPVGGVIDFDVSDLNVDDINLNVDDNIDWGNVGVEDAAGEAEIDFNISLEESGIVVEAAGHDGGTATGNDALTILDNPITRNDLIDQLFELESFLKIRLYELKSDNGKNLLSMSQMQEASSILQLATQESTQNMLDNVQVLLTEMLDNRVQHLHNIKHSPRYVDMLADTLKQKLSLIDKMVAMQKLVKGKREEALEQSVALQPILKLVVQRTRELQSEIEQDISKKYKNRPVRLTGGINAL